ncbi:MAG: DegT/DnrJ/EryC1/StrS family aminotransferase [Sumerlaeia bacterium]
MSVPFMDLAADNEPLLEDFLEDLKEVFESGHFVGGPTVQKFEETFSRFIGVKQTVSCGSGSDSLTMALRAVGVGGGDEVLCPAFGYASVPEAVARLGATPVFVDCHPGTYCMDPEKAVSNMNQRTKAIIAVHLYGQACDVNKITHVARTDSVIVMEDVRQATGARIGNRRLGTYGDFGIFSFHPENPLGGVGDGGAVTTNHERHAETIRFLKDHGRASGAEVSDYVGYNSRLDAIQAVMILQKLQDLDEDNAERIENARLYNKMFAGSPVQTPQFFDDGSHIYSNYVVMVPERDKLVETLKAKNIGYRLPCPQACHLQPAFSYLGYQQGAFPVAEELAAKALALPICPNLKKKHIETVGETILGHYGAAI